MSDAHQDLEARIAKVRESFGAQEMMRTLGAEMTDVTSDQVVISAPIHKAVTQQHGAAHAGLAFAIGDSAAGYAALMTMPLEDEVVTSEMKIHLLAPAIGDALIAKGRVIRPGRRLVIVTSDVWAEANGARRHIATLLGTMVPVRS